MPVYHDGFFYGFSNRFMVSIDAETGEPAWKSRRPGDGFLMVLDGHLVILTKRGSLHVARASGEGYDEVAALDLFEDNAWTAPSFADGDLWVRSFGELARVGLGRAASAAPVAEAQPAAPSDSRWAAFLAEVDAAEDKDAAVDAFLESVASFPIVEGETTVHFVYHGDAEDMAIVGDIIEGRHQEPMRQLSGTRLFYYTAEVAPDAAIKYQFVKDFETVLDERNPNRVEAVLFGLEEYSWLKMPGYETPAFLDEPTGPRGRIEVVELPVPELEDTQRTIQVYLPAGYDESDGRYPVAYLHGGNQALDRGQWAIALDNLIGRSVRPLIVVFIHPAGEPGYESRPPGAILYGRAFVGQIVPAIDERFRTIASSEGRANVGIGFSGLTAFLTTFNAPGVFGKVSTQSPFMLSSMEDMLRAATPAAADVPLDIYLDWGRYDPYSVVENWNLIESSRRTDQFLRDKGYQPAGGEFSGGYGFPAWRARTGAMLEALFPLEE